MRLRNIPEARDGIAASPLVVQKPELLRGSWRETFARRAPLYLEIGMGKGRFLTSLAAAHPENNYVGLEMYSTVLYKAVQRAERLPAAKAENGTQPETGAADVPVPADRNFCFVRMDATELETVFAPGEADGIYLNFSDPWPKDRHAHRRLTSDRFLARYEKVLVPGGFVEFKTDNRALFDYSVESFRDKKWEITALTYDLHADAALCAGNIMSEYEEKFSSRGNPICKLRAVFPG